MSVERIGKRMARRGRRECGLIVALLLHGTVVLAQPEPGPCFGDCSGDGAVSVDELVKGVNVALARQPLADCTPFDADGDGRVTIEELIQAVRAALDGCVQPSATTTPPTTATPTATPSPSATPSATPTHTPTTPPNIVLINLDDTRADGIDRMPTVLSRLAAHGVSFTNSFVVDPLCAPSRASLLTGLSARHHGTEALNGVIGGAHRFRELGADQQTVAVWLQRAGYATGLFGKYINGYGPTEHDRGPGGTFYVPPGWTRWRGMMSPEHYGGIHGGTYTVVDEHGVPTVYDDHTSDLQYSTDLLAGELRTFIADTVSQGRPFFAVWTPYASHADTPSFLPQPADRHSPFFNDLPLWRPASWDEPDVTDKPRWIQQDQMPTDPALAIFTEVIRRWAYKTLLAVDEDLALILDDLVQLGIDDNTVILLTSDNGTGWGEHRLFAQAKECPYEECLRVPMIVRDPRFGSTAIVRDATVLNVDVAPTVAALAGVVPPVSTDGVSFAPWVMGLPPVPWRDDFLLEHWRGDRSERLGYSGQVTDGDQLRLLYGAPRAQPRASVLCEFDGGDGVTAGAVAVPIGVDADASFANLGAAVVAAVPFTAESHNPGTHQLGLVDDSADHDGVYVLVERDEGAVIQHAYPVPDYFGVRDVTHGFTYVEHESGEVELYDLTADPAQLENKAGDPAYAETRERLAQRLEELLK